jgi:hypothetical protein
MKATRVCNFRSSLRIESPGRRPGSGYKQDVPITLIDPVLDPIRVHTLPFLLSELDTPRASLPTRFGRSLELRFRR